jgi:hypothetical protein
MTQFKPLAFVDGVDLVVQSTSGFVYSATAADIQDQGVMVEYLDNSVAKRGLIPWTRVALIFQNI